MAHPYETNHEEARDVGQVGRPKIGHCPEQMPARAGSDRQIEHKQRDRDREDAVAECLESGRGEDGVVCRAFVVFS